MYSIVMGSILYADVVTFSFEFFLVARAMRIATDDIGKSVQSLLLAHG